MSSLQASGQKTVPPVRNEVSRVEGNTPWFFIESDHLHLIEPIKLATYHINMAKERLCQAVLIQ